MSAREGLETSCIGDYCNIKVKADKSANTYGVTMTGCFQLFIRRGLEAF